jgi:hypothetical protein
MAEPSALSNVVPSGPVKWVPPDARLSPTRPCQRRGFAADSSTSPGTLRKMPSLETSGTPRRIAVAATQRSALCSRWLRAWPIRSHWALSRA